MKRRSKAGGKAINAGSRKAALKRASLSRARANPPVPTIEDTETARLIRERDEALEQQRATTEVLRAISRSPGDLDLLFKTMLANATHICEAQFGTLYRFDGTAFSHAAGHGTPDALTQAQKQQGRFIPEPGTPMHRVMRAKTVAHSADYAAESALGLSAKFGGARSTVVVPMLKNNELIGAFAIYRQEVRPFTDEQIELLQSFAAQAVIAIENARLFEAEQQRTRELSESLEQQIATSEVLRVISTSRGDLAPVFTAILDNALRLGEAAFGFVTTYDGKRFERAAQRGVPDALAAYFETGMDEPRPGDAHWRLLAGEELIHNHDQMDEEAYRSGNPLRRAIVDLGGARSALVVALRQGKVLLGALTVYRKEVRPFAEKQIELLKHFAAQAVIAIENARLLNELRQRTGDLAESLEHQTATSEVLSVISRSPTDTQPVFDAICESASRLFSDAFTVIWRYDGELLHYVASHNFTPEVLDRLFNSYPKRIDRSLAAGRAILDGKLAHVPDMLADPDYRHEFALAGNWRASIAVPMLRDGKPIGAISVGKAEAEPFSERQQELLTTFADQAVIAIENARLFEAEQQRTRELSESLEQQTATSEVLRVISTSPGDLRAVFDAMLASATRLCQASYGTMWLHESDGEMRVAARHGDLPETFRDQWHIGRTFRPSPSVPTARAFNTRKPVHVTDLKEDRSYLDRDPLAVASVEIAGIRSLIAVPILKDDAILGTLNVYRREVRPFAEKQIELLKSFAAQAVIAIENARLLNDLNKLNQQLEQRVSDQVGEIERMSRLRRFLPPQVADLIVASGTEQQLESHRREITALFCDLRGFTGFSESSDPEDVMALLRDYHAAIGAIILKYSGTLERYAGDGVMVVFNDPVPVENPALQAVLMALELRGALGVLTDRWRRLGHEIGFGIGIAHGFATLGTIGFEGRFDYAAIGTVSNVASRLCDEATTGQILISPRVLMKIEDAVTIEPIGEFTLKGIRRPMAAYNVLSALSPKALN
jgi:GAF domain-containing protein